jgi:uncharacterized damage-inducible protein DinB
MTASLLDDAFGHHIWATLQLIDACATLGTHELEVATPGTYGSILETMRHLVGSDRWYLLVMSGGRVPGIDEEAMDLDELRRTMAADGDEWSRLLAGDPDPEQVLTRRRDDGSTTEAPMGIRFAQAIHHGTDHRSQICTALTTLGHQPPEIDVWDYGLQRGEVVDHPSPS